MKITTYNTQLNEDRCCVLVKENSVNYCPDFSKFTEPRHIYRLMCDVFKHNIQTEEYLYLLCLDVKGRLIGIFEISHGSANASICNPREIFMKTMLCNATNIILAHNHPSGDVVPSETDINTARQLKEAAKIMGICFLDNMIIGEGYYSFKEMNLL